MAVVCGCGSGTKDRISMEQYGSVRTDTADEMNETDETDAADDVGAAQDVQDKLYLVVSVNTEDQLIVLGRPDSLRTVQYSYTKGTQILDEYGDYMSASRLQEGRAVTLGELDHEAKLTRIQLAEQAWYQENITRFSIDPELGMFTIGDTKYRYDSYLRVFSGDGEISVTQLAEGDVLSVQGLDRQILSVRVTQGHGTIALMNTELFEGGWISLGTKIYAKVTPDMQLIVPEGTYELSVANDGWGDSGTVEVLRGEVTKVDLNDYKGEGPKFCQVTFEVHVDGALLYINGEEIAYDEPVELRYGVYKLTVIADGFDTWERQLVIHSEEAAIQIGEPQLADTDDEEDDSEPVQAAQPSDRDTTDTSDTSASQTDATDTSGTSDSTDYSTYLDTISDLLKSLTGGSD